MNTQQASPVRNPWLNWDLANVSLPLGSFPYALYVESCIANGDADRVKERNFFAATGQCSVVESVKQRICLYVDTLKWDTSDRSIY